MREKKTRSAQRLFLFTLTLDLFRLSCLGPEHSWFLIQDEAESNTALLSFANVTVLHLDRPAGLKYIQSSVFGLPTLVETIITTSANSGPLLSPLPYPARFNVYVLQIIPTDTLTDFEINRAQG